MRIVLLHNIALKASFRRLGHDVFHIGTDQACDVVLTEPLSHRRLLALLAAKFPDPDLVVWSDSCQPPWVFGLEALPAVVIGYSVDQYMNPWHVPYSAAFDGVFVAQKDYLPLFAQPAFERPVRWLPFFAIPNGPAIPRHPGTFRFPSSGPWKATVIPPAGLFWTHFEPGRRCWPKPAPTPRSSVAADWS